MPDGIGSLYPRPPENPLSNPLNVVGLMRGLQEFGIRQQQAPALEQIPQAELQGVQQRQNIVAGDYARQFLANAAIARGRPSTRDDVNSDAANAMKNLGPAFATQVGAAADYLLKDGESKILDNARTALGTFVQPGQMTQVVHPATGQPMLVPTAAIAGGQGIPTGLAPGSSQSIDAMQKDLQRAGQYSQEIFPWQQALSRMQDMASKGQTFGPGSKGRQELESFAYALSPTVSRWAGVDPEKIAGYAEVEKYLTQGLQNRAQGFSARTDMQLATAATGTPNVHITDLAGIPLVKAAIGLRRMEQAQTINNAARGGPNYTANIASWAPQQDARAYMIDMMSPDEIRKLQTTLKGPERARFNSSLRAAINAGVIAQPGQ